MWSILKGEWRKLRRCQILLVGIVALALCPVVQYGSQLILNPEMRDPNYNFVTLFSNVVWGNTQMFLPLSLVMIGGWLIDRENTNDTMKNLLTVPVSYPKLLGGKLIVTMSLSLLFGIYSVAVTVLAGWLVGLGGFSSTVLLQQGTQVIAAAFTTGLVCNADDPDLRPDTRGLSGWLAADVLPGVLHLVLQGRLPALRLSVFGGADSRRF